MGRGRLGFTLIELLVVIAIIAILAAILFPIFAGAKNRSQMTKCLNNLKQLGNAMRMYSDDNSGRMPYDWPVSTGTSAAKNNWCGCPAAGGWVYPERGQIWRYTRNASIYRCPVDSHRAAVKITSFPAGMTNKDYPLSYSMNHNVAEAIADTLPNPTKRMLLIHENRGESINDFAINDGTFVPGGQDFPGAVHYDGTTLVYLDGHATWKSNKLLRKENTRDW